MMTAGLTRDLLSKIVVKVLIVCSGNTKDGTIFDFHLHQAFIFEQIEAVKEQFEISYSTFFIQGHGVIGYLRNLSSLKRKIREYNPDIVHAHFVTSALLAVLQRQKPVIVTYHGSDINDKKIRFFSVIIMLFSNWSVFVSEKLFNKSFFKNAHRSSVIPCGIDLTTFFPVQKADARQSLKWDPQRKIVLFCSSFNNHDKNPKLARAAMEFFPDTTLVELKNKTRQDVNLMLNACDLLLLTSFSEGSPQIIKEAMACNCPIVATDVGDIREVTGATEGCFITTFAPAEVAEKIRMALAFGQRTKGRDQVAKFDNMVVVRKLFDVYQGIIKKRTDT
ncbi:MAG: glycosyltransferase family 4 protein [Bacteroidetes bacterium]|nr:glycosyltransferase family 4 protein [Bacteroidota bacterium]